MPTKQKPVTSNSLTKWDQRLADLAKKKVQTVADIGGGAFISIKAGVMTWNGAEIPGNKANVVILCDTKENDYYTGGFDPDNIAVPDCFAFGQTLAEMRPHELATNPQGGESGGCRDCPQNEFGTSDRGKGKACQNRIRMALITEGDLKKDIATAEVAYLKIPPTSLKGYAGYVRDLEATYQRPTFAVVTEVAVVPDAKTQLKVTFKLVSTIDDADVLEQLFNRSERVAKEIDFPYQPIAEDAAPAPRKPLKGQRAPAQPAQPARGARR